MVHRERGREGSSLSGLAQLERQTMEGSLKIRHNLNSVIEELRPSVQARTDASNITLSNWIKSRSSHSASNSPHPFTKNDGESTSFVITIESEDRDSSGASSTRVDDRFNHSLPSSHVSSVPLDTSVLITSESNNNNNTHEESIADLLNGSPEATSFVNFIKNYLPFVTIILAKTVYDYFPDILMFILLYGTFAMYNTKIAQHSRRSTRHVMGAAAHLVFTIRFFYRHYGGMKLYLSLVCIPPYVQPLTVSDLLWMVTVTDLILKLITIIVKILITLIPHNLFEANRRGKWYDAIESSSQLYRSLAPIQPWLYYLLEFYQGPQKVVGMFLSAAYVVCKCAELMRRTRAWWSSVLKLLKNVPLGVSPDKEQLKSAGVICPICHGDYDTPVLLPCRHVFCESCLSSWFDREQTCPMCRAKVGDDPCWRDGSTSHFLQLF